MSNKKKINMVGICLVVFSLAISSANPIVVYAEDEEAKEPQVMVSLGDSYSSGEGIEPFYGQELSNEQKVLNEDWLAHRSEKSWPGLLVLPGNEGTMADNKDKYWYFEAASGAVTDNLSYAFTKEYEKGEIKGRYHLAPQLAIFDELSQQGIEADYVTITIGGNDVGFADIIKKCVCGSKFLNFGGLSDKLEDTWEDFEADGGIKDRLIDAYVSISEVAPNAEIIVVGYPKLLAKEGGKDFISKEEATEVNENVSKFNAAIETIVFACESEKMNISFVSVEEAFDGHEAYSEKPYINEIIWGAEDEDLKDLLPALKDFNFTSAYSIHPNEEGAKVYASCVQKKIDEIEAEKQNTGMNGGLSDNSEATNSELEAEEINYSGVVIRPEDVVLKMFEALKKGDYETVAECLDPATEQELDFWGGIASTLAQLFTGEYLSWGQLVLEAAGATEVEVIDCYSENLIMESNVDIFSEWIPKIPGLNNLVCTEADVYVKYRYKYENQYYTVKDKYHVKRYEWSGWRIEDEY